MKAAVQIRGKIVLLLLAAVFMVFACAPAYSAAWDKKWSLTFNDVLVGNDVIEEISSAAIDNPGLLSCIPSLGYMLNDNSELNFGCMQWNFQQLHSTTNYVRYTYYFGKGSLAPHISLDGAFTTMPMYNWSTSAYETKDFSNMSLIAGTEIDYYDIAFLLDLRLVTIASMTTTKGDISDDYRNATVTNIVPYLSIKWSF